MKNKIEKWYKQGLWTAEMVGNAVGKKIITAAEYEEICGEAYEAVE